MDGKKMNFCFFNSQRLEKGLILRKIDKVDRKMETPKLDELANEISSLSDPTRAREIFVHKQEGVA